ncbi:MAG: TrmH family RNA methyltransferase [Rhodothermaceae bacterium]|nr:TrmH family RNA methyltransferase [Rhodothermaceae bacterium]
MRKLLHEEIPRIQASSLHEHPRHPITVVVDNVRSIHNVGSFFRTSDGAWIEKMILTGITGTPENRALHKTALGAQDTIPWSHSMHTLDAASQLKEQGYRLAVLELTDTPTLSTDLTLADFPLALVIGNELTGVHSEVVDMADYALEIPQYGTKQSLNVSVAFGIAVFDLVRQYRTLAGHPLLSDPFDRPTPKHHD